MIWNWVGYKSSDETAGHITADGLKEALYAWGLDEAWMTTDSGSNMRALHVYYK